MLRSLVKTIAPSARRAYHSSRQGSRILGSSAPEGTAATQVRFVEACKHTSLQLVDLSLCLEVDSDHSRHGSQTQYQATQLRAITRGVLDLPINTED